MDNDNLQKLVTELCKLPNETGWVEFKCDNYNPDIIGQNICALANSAALHDKDWGYMVWGIDDTTHEIVGSKYNLQNLKVGRQELECWLRVLLSSNIEYQFYEVLFPDNIRVGLLKIRKAYTQTASFKKVEYIRVGSYTKKLSDVPALRAQLWDKIRNSKFEKLISKEHLTAEQILGLLAWEKYFDINKKAYPSNQEEIVRYLIEEEILQKQDDGLYSVTNLGAILLARNIRDFRSIERKAIRVIQYSSKNRFGDTKEYICEAGYAVCFEQLLQYIGALTPTKEKITGAYRENISIYPQIAVRETIANALIHQDFSISGSGPLIEIFQDRIEVTNPGTPLVSVERIIDNPPKSRNERLAACMRRMKMCEELGTGWDKIVISCEAMFLPAPRIIVYDESTKVTLFSEIPYANIAYDDKIRACYMHACIKYVQNEHLTNSSLRKRFGLKETNSGSVSRLIKASVEKRLVKPFDDTTSPKNMSYIPFWA